MSDLADVLGAPADHDTVKQLREARERIDRLERLVEYSGRSLRVPKWTTAKTKRGDKTATLCTILSDTHFDEVVNPSELGNPPRNAYDRDIARLRLRRYFDGVVRIPRDYLAGMAFDGVCLFLAGDLVSGDIHDELSATNADVMLGTVLYWSEQLAAGITLLADELGVPIHVVAVAGNHGRRHRKPRMKQRARDNYDWLIAQLLARHFDRDDRVTFEIPDGTDALVTIHDTRFLVTHGDQVSGGGGIGGHWPPLMRLIAKKRTRYTFDALLCGHWHSLIMSANQGLVCNGSLKGEDEYSAIMGFTPEPPQQALFTVAPGHGVTFSAPVFVSDRTAEGW